MQSVTTTVAASQNVMHFVWYELLTETENLNNHILSKSKIRWIDRNAESIIRFLSCCFIFSSLFSASKGCRKEMQRNGGGECVFGLEIFDMYFFGTLAFNLWNSICCFLLISDFFFFPFRCCPFARGHFIRTVAVACLHTQWSRQHPTFYDKLTLMLSTRSNNLESIARYTYYLRYIFLFSFPLVSSRLPCITDSCICFFFLCL